MTCGLLPFADVAGVCDACGSPLGARRRRWCSKRCNWRWVVQHRWTEARKAARNRDRSSANPRRNGCVREGCESTDPLEVNHIVPRNGAGYGFGCWNHLENLETLCLLHHLVETRRQREERKNG